MKKKLVPELHDIFKLTEYGHINTVSNPLPSHLQKSLPDTPTVEGILRHHLGRGFIDHPNSPETVILCIADDMAASFSRGEEGRGEPVYFVQKLWQKPTKKQITYIPPEEIIGFLGTNPSKNDFFSKYEKPLKERSEDAHTSRAITSLYTHLKITGQFYRILSSIKQFQIDATQAIDLNLQSMAKIIRERLENKKWKLTILRCKFHFPQNPLRAIDLNVYIFLEEYLRKVENSFPDNILLRTSDEILILTVNADTTINQLKDLLEGRNFWIETFKATRPIGDLKPNPEDNSGCKSENIYLDPPSEIELPICENCQMAHATREWRRPSATEEGVREFLCDSCFSFREMGSRLPKLFQWEEKGTSRVLWLRIDLDFEKLINVLNKLYTDYLNTANLSIPPEKAKIRFSVISEFQEDYNLFLSQLNKSIEQKFGEESIQTILNNYFCLKIKKRSNIFEILEIYHQLLNEIFPKFLEIENSPIILKAVYSSIKFPFFEVWRRLNQAREEINISVIGHGEIKTKTKFISQLLIASKGKYKKSSLHKLAEISKLYESLARLQFKDRSDKEDYPTYSQLNRNLLPLGMDFRSILTFIKLIGE